MADRAPTLLSGYIYAILAVLIWSGFNLVSRVGGISPLTAFDTTALRFGVAGLILFPIWCWQRPVRLFDKRILGLGIIGGISYSLFVYSGFKFAPAAYAAIMLPGTMPFLITLFAWLLLEERPSKLRCFGLGVIALGVICLASDSWRSPADVWLGTLLFLAGSACWSLYTVLSRRWAVRPWEATVGVVLVAAMIYLPVYLLFLPKTIAAASWNIIAMQGFYQGVMASILVMIFYLRAVATIGATGMGGFMALVPAISGFAAIPLLDEPVSATLGAGLVLTSVGAYFGSRPQPLQVHGKFETPGKP